ncbi:MAG: folylpolyglutamate synthase/dihydrofolate synthase family protein [Acutalibacteraceae bacterium]|nr:folylpolyglutamate synthase/dihydrofolate synthase family protein [Acutalibacteraceae bacterium]
MILTYKEALEKIDSLLVFGSHPGLDRIKKLLDLTGNPQDKLKYVHVAGTNGKGSVSNMTASILKNAGYKTGLFTSPHITGFGERMQINNEQITEADIISLTERLFPFVQSMNEKGEIITEFEFVTVMAFHYFAEQKCDVVVLETGLGGRLDATNVIKKPLCSVITSISLDHTAVLGDTLSKIAFEKCGIIKENSKTVFATQEDEVNEVVFTTACERKNVLYTPVNLSVLDSDISGTTVEYSGVKIKLPLLGQHQVKNMQLVLSVVSALKESGLSISEENVKQGIESVIMPARFELFSKEPLIIVDGAHNPGGCKALACAVDRYLSDKKIVCIMGMLKDKDSGTAIEYLRGKFCKVITTSVANSPRRQTAEELKSKAKDVFTDITACEDYKQAVDLALEIAKQEQNSAVLVCGSLYLASDIRVYLSEILNKEHL